MLHWDCKMGQTLLKNRRRVARLLLWIVGASTQFSARPSESRTWTRYCGLGAYP
jgi:hypothetical protein